MLPVISLAFRFSGPASAVSPAFPEATWRGAFGYALKRTVCLTRLRACSGCAYEYTCAYPLVFETRPDPAPSIFAGSDHTPKPFVLRLPRPEPAGGPGPTVEMVLIGGAAKHLPAIIHAMSEAGRRGIGKARAVFDLEEVAGPDGETLWRPGSNLAPVEPRAPRARAPRRGPVRVTLRSPLRLVRGGQPLRPGELDGPTLGFAAVHRVGLLASRFCRDVALDFRSLKAESQTITIVDRQLDWEDRRRFSSRQRRLITIGGLIGSLTLDASAAPGVAACLETCETVHVGKGATLGFGRIALADA